MCVVTACALLTGGLLSVGRLIVRTYRPERDRQVVVVWTLRRPLLLVLVMKRFDEVFRQLFISALANGERSVIS